MTRIHITTNDPHETRDALGHEDAWKQAMALSDAQHETGQPISVTVKEAT